MTVDLDRDVWDDLARSLRGPAGDLISPGTIQNFEEGYRLALDRRIAAITFDVSPEEVTEDMVAWLRAQPGLSMFRSRFEVEEEKE